MLEIAQNFVLSAKRDEEGEKESCAGYSAGLARAREGALETDRVVSAFMRLVKLEPESALRKTAFSSPSAIEGQLCPFLLLWFQFLVLDSAKF